MGLGGNRPTAQPLMTDVCPTLRRPENHATSPVSEGAGISVFRDGIAATLPSAAGSHELSTLQTSQALTAGWETIGLGFLSVGCISKPQWPGVWRCEQEQTVSYSEFSRFHGCSIFA